MLDLTERLLAMELSITKTEDFVKYLLLKSRSVRSLSVAVQVKICYFAKSHRGGGLLRQKKNKIGGEPLITFFARTTKLQKRFWRVGLPFLMRLPN